MPQLTSQSPRSRLYTVSELTSKIRQILEDAFPFVRITGEVSNLRIPASGHYYFTLKDDSAQISGVMFRGQVRALKFQLEDGMEIAALGRISVYEPRGTYQIILEHVEPKGVGALQKAFEQLKKRLSAQGYFDAEHKMPLPFLPRRIAAITSPSGAVIRDILHVLNRRHPGIRVDVAPVRVQGAGAEDEIAAALQLVNRHDKADVIILARGGGSLEDLQAFNSEKVAMAVFHSKIPVISAVGHETDYTIADFVADLRAPTPSAAAELAVPSKKKLIKTIEQYHININYYLKQIIKNTRHQYLNTVHRLKDPKRSIYDFRLTLDNAEYRINRAIRKIVETKVYRHRLSTDRLMSQSPIQNILSAKVELSHLNTLMRQHIKGMLRGNINAFTRQQSKLEALNPLAILSRGYTVTRTVPDGTIIKDAAQVDIGQHLDIWFAESRLLAEVNKKMDYESTNSSSAQKKPTEFSLIEKQR